MSKECGGAAECMLMQCFIDVSVSFTCFTSTKVQILTPNVC